MKSPPRVGRRSYELDEATFLTLRRLRDQNPPSKLEIEAAETALYNQLVAHAEAVLWERFRKHLPEEAHEAAVDCLMAFDKFRGESRYTTWFHRIAWRQGNRWLAQQHKHRNEVSLDSLTEADEPGKYDSEEAALWSSLTNGLDSTDLTLLQARVEGLSWREIAKKLGWKTPHGPKQRLGRLKKRLLQELGVDILKLSRPI
jgi:RNA polymerase sigma factor (sigma-70 family)